jgi:uncharacterized membrane protein
MMAGIFFIFSTTIMRALKSLAPNEGIAAMQAINLVIVRPLFLAVFLGTAGACAVIMIGALLRLSQPGAWWDVMGGGLYVIGAFGVTVVCNIPLNNRLATLEASDPLAASGWAHYLRSWTPWNHVRTVASIAAAAALMWK